MWVILSQNGRATLRSLDESQGTCITSRPDKLASESTARTTISASLVRRNLTNAYDELIAEFVLNAEPSSCKTLTAVLAAWWSECKHRYQKGRGKLGGAQNWRPVIRLLREQHGEERAEDLGPKKLRLTLETAAVEHDWSLTYTKMRLTKVSRSSCRPKSPNLNSQLERYFGSLKSEDLRRMIFFGEASLRAAVQPASRRRIA